MINEWLNDGISVAYCTAPVFVRQPLIMFVGLPHAITICFHSVAQFLEPTYGTLALNSLLLLPIKSYTSLCRVVFTLPYNIAKYHNNLSVRKTSRPSIHASIRLSVCPSVCPSVCMFTHLPVRSGVLSHPINLTTILHFLEIHFTPQPSSNWRLRKLSTLMSRAIVKRDRVFSR